MRDVVNDSGAVIKSFEFDEYGNLLSSSGTGATSPKTWIGGLSVNDDRADSGMFNMGYRNYAAGVLGRFISRDPIGHAGGLNLYSYTTNPVNYMDPTGLELTMDGETSAANTLKRYLARRTGLKLLLENGVLTSTGESETCEDPVLKDVLLDLIEGTVSRNIRAKYLKSTSHIGTQAGPGGQAIDIGDILQVEKVNSALASALTAHELTELLESPYYPVQTKEEHRQVFQTHLHPKGLACERKSGFDRIYDNTTTVKGEAYTLRTGHTIFNYLHGGEGFQLHMINGEGSFDVFILPQK